MKYIRESFIIFALTLAGEFLNHVLPLPVPAGVYGLFLMLVLLCTGVLKVDQVEATGNFLLDIMPVMFIPASVGLLESMGALQAVLVPVVVISLVSTVFVMAVTGIIAEKMLGGKKS
ncbi:MAG: CidA/LrgA family protein [Lachnospiraceae bacterium]|jgi:holin-like protein|nr:CidA/LrgA family protein [Lachnospiraceae bacterium]MCI8960109.1 CidA/LrgA family protein [Lachnospiraceae bacterium]